MPSLLEESEVGMLPDPPVVTFPLLRDASMSSIGRVFPGGNPLSIPSVRPQRRQNILSKKRPWDEETKHLKLRY